MYPGYDNYLNIIYMMQSYMSCFIFNNCNAFSF